MMMNQGLSIAGEAGRNQTEGCCEKICKLFLNVGKALELNPKSKAASEKLLQDVETVVQNSHLPMRHKFMLAVRLSSPGLNSSFPFVSAFSILL